MASIVVAPKRTSKRVKKLKLPSFVGCDPGSQGLSQEYVDYEPENDDSSTDSSMDVEEGEVAGPSGLKHMQVEKRSMSQDFKPFPPTKRQKLDTFSFEQEVQATISPNPFSIRRDHAGSRITTHFGRGHVKESRSSSPDSVIVIDSSEDDETVSAAMPLPSITSINSSQALNRPATPDSVVDGDSSDEEPLTIRRPLARASFKNFSKQVPLEEVTEDTANDERPLSHRNNGQALPSSTIYAQTPVHGPPTAMNAEDAPKNPLTRSIPRPSSKEQSVSTASEARKSVMDRLRASPETSIASAPSTVSARTQLQATTATEGSPPSYLSTLSLAPTSSSQVPRMTSMQSMMDAVHRMRARRELEEQEAREVHRSMRIDSIQD